MRAPVAPIGWPSAIAPPLTLTRAGSSEQVPSARDDLGREGLVELDQVDVGEREARLLEQRADRGHRADPHARGLDARREVHATTRASGSTPALRASSSVARTSAAAPSVTPEELPACTVPFGSKTGSSRASASTVESGRGMLVARDLGRALLAGDRDRRDLVREAALRDRAPRPPLRLDGVGVLLGAQDAVLADEVLGRLAHQLAAERAEEPVLVHGVHDLGVAHAHPESNARQQVRRRRHALGSAGEHDVVLARRDRERAERERLEARRAGLVDRVGRHGVRDAGAVGDLARRVRAAARLARVPEDRLVHGRRRQARAHRAPPSRRPRPGPPRTATRTSRRTCRSACGRRRGRRRGAWRRGLYRRGSSSPGSLARSG